MSAPFSQTVVLKDLRNNVSDRDVLRFVAGATPCVQRVCVMDDLYPVNKGYARYAYVNYGDRHQAGDAKGKIDEAIRIAKAKADPIDPTYLTCFVRSAGPSLKPSFSLWIGNIGDDEEASIKNKMRHFGSLTSISVHGVPPIKVMEKAPGLRSAFVNYCRFGEAKAALDAVEAGAVVFGKATRRHGLARRGPNTRLVFDLLDRCRTSRSTCLTFTEAQQAADSLGQDRPVAWVDVLRCCPEVFPVVDESSGFISVEEAWVHSKAPPPAAAIAYAPVRGAAASSERAPSPWALESLQRMEAMSLAPTPPRSPEPTPAAAGLLTCGFAAGAGGAWKDGVDGKQLVDLIGDAKWRALAVLKVEEGGLGLTPLQLLHLMLEVRLLQLGDTTWGGFL